MTATTAGGATSTGGGGTTSITDTAASDTSGDTTSGDTTGGTMTTGTATTGSSCVPADEVCDGQDNNCDEQADEGEACPTGCQGAIFGEHIYVFCDSPPGATGAARPARNWTQARQFCADRGQLLLSIETAEEGAFVYEQLNLGGAEADVWMAATDQEEEDTWTWALSDSPETWLEFYDASSGEPIGESFVDWREGEPNDMGGEDCGLIEDQGDGEWLWDDRACQDALDWLVCEG